MGFKRAPKEIQEAFVELKHRLNRPLSLHEIYGCYYIYGYSSIRDSKKCRTIIKTFYLGRLSKDGKFVSKEEAQQIKEEAPATIGMNQVDNAEMYEREAIALKNLSMNGRMSAGKLAKRIGMSVAGARHFVKRLEKKYNIRYFAEVNMLKLGYIRYIALVKFEAKIPRFDEVKAAFEDDSHIAFAAMTKGAYDMIVIFYIENTQSPTLFLYEWRSSKALPNYAAKWYVAPLGKAPDATLPLRLQTIDWVSENVTHKSNIKTAAPNKLTKVEGITLKELVLDGNQDFKSLDRKYELGQGRSNYAFYKLKEKGIIERITLTITPPNLRYNAVFITETNHYKKFIEVRHQFHLNLIHQESPILNKDAYRGDMGIPDSILRIRPIFGESEFQKIRTELDSIAGTKTDSLIITDIVTGGLCYRNFDFTHSPIYSDLMSQGKVPNLSPTDY